MFASTGVLTVVQYADGELNELSAEWSNHSPCLLAPLDATPYPDRRKTGYSVFHLWTISLTGENKPNAVGYGVQMNTPHSQPSALSSGHFETNGKSRRKNSRKRRAWSHPTSVCWKAPQNPLIWKYCSCWRKLSGQSRLSPSLRWKALWPRPLQKPAG